MTRGHGTALKLLAARQRLLAYGGLGAVLGLARQPETAHAAHQLEDIGIGVVNPTAGSAPTTVTQLNTNTGGSDGFSVHQAQNSSGDAVNGYGGPNAATGSGGDGVFGSGGGTIGAFGAGRLGGTGVIGEGGSGGTAGGGGLGASFVGGGSSTVPGLGAEARGGQNTASALAVGGTGLLGRGGYGGNGVTRTGIGVLGQSTAAEGVRGESAFGPGALGVSANYVGVYANSATHWGALRPGTWLRRGVPGVGLHRRRP